MYELPVATSKEYPADWDNIVCSDEVCTGCKGSITIGEAINAGVCSLCYWQAVETALLENLPHEDKK